MPEFISWAGSVVAGDLGGSLLSEAHEGRLGIEIRFPVATAFGKRAA